MWESEYQLKCSDPITMYLSPYLLASQVLSRCPSPPVVVCLPLPSYGGGGGGGGVPNTLSIADTTIRRSTSRYSHANAHSFGFSTCISAKEPRTMGLLALASSSYRGSHGNLAR